MNPIKEFPQSLHPGLVEALHAAGIELWNDGGVWKSNEPEAAQLMAATFNPEGYVKAEKAKELAEARWLKETGGFWFQPGRADRAYRFKSTRDAVAPVLALPVFAMAGITKSRRWKTDEVDAAGHPIFVTIEAADFVPFATAFGAHVEAAFVEEEEKNAQAKAADWRDADAIKIEAAVAEKG